MTTNHSLLDLTADFFAAQRMPYTRNDDQSYLETHVAGTAADWHCYAHTFEGRNQLVFYSVCPATTPVARQPALAQFACALNYQLAFGNLEMSEQSGELRFRTVVETVGGRLTADLIAPVVLNNIGMMDDLAPILLALISGELSPEAALAQTRRMMAR